jgi:NRPS condensation-like uncharacterized protein
VSQPGPPAPGRTRFAIADELTCYYDRPDEPANVHLEAQVEGRIDESALRQAVAGVIAEHRGLRVRQADTGAWRRGYYWEHSAAADRDPVRSASQADEAELARLRSAFLSEAPPLRQAPPFELLLASWPAGDALIINAHHARFDGLSVLRLLREVAARYRHLTSAPAGDDRPSSGSERPGSQATGPVSAGPTDDQSATRSGGLRVAGRGRIARVAGQLEAGSPGGLPGYGAELMTWDGLPDAAEFRTSAGCSINDLLIAALILTISDWNLAHGARPGLIQVTMPVGDQAQGGPEGQWANRSRLTAVGARMRPDLTTAGLISEVAAQTRQAKRQPGAQVDGFSRALTAAPVPVAVKQLLLRTALLLAGPFVCDSSLISNLGVVAPVSFGAAGDARIWFSTSAHLPRGLSLGAATAGDELRLVFRYRLALFGAEAAGEFAGRYRERLDAIVGRRVAV